MADMFSFGKARNRLERWLLGNDTAALPETRSEIPKDQPASRPSDSHDERFRLFMEELEASSQEWLGKVRLINLDSIREHVGPGWAKLQDRVELLAEKVIREAMTSRDKLLNMGGAEFLVFFADATPEESRIRCLAIVEAIREKLFGIGDHAGDPLRRVAECHVIHRDELGLEWEAESSANFPRHSNEPPAEVLRRSFRQDPELLDGADISTSTQIVIDSIISRGAESRNIGEMAPLLLRLKSLSRDLKTLEPTLAAARRIASPRRRDGDGDIDNPNAMPLGTAWKDIRALVSVLDRGPDYSHADLLTELKQLQRARLERAKGAAADEDIPASRVGIENADTTQFEYVPVYRSISRGERIHQGIYRVDCRTSGRAGGEASDAGLIGLPQREALILERLTLEHAIRYLSDRGAGKRLMLMVSVHVETLRGPYSLRRISMILRAAQLRAKRRLLIEVVDYHDTDDTIGIQRAIEELRGHAHAVFVTLAHKNIRSLDKVAASCKQLGVHALGMDVSKFNGPEAVIVDALTRMSSVGQRCPIAIYVTGIASVPILAKAIACGISYVCAPALRPPLQTPEDAGHAALDDLYSAV